MDTVFFVFSKLFGTALKLETWLLVIAVLTFWASLRSWARVAKVASATLVLAILGIGLLPLGDVLMRPLEADFPIKKALGQVDGIIVLGGGEDVLVAAPAEIHHDDLVLAHGRGALDHFGQRMGRLQRRDDALGAGQELESLQRFGVHDRHIFDPA